MVAIINFRIYRSYLSTSLFSQSLDANLKYLDYNDCSIAISGPIKFILWWMVGVDHLATWWRSDMPLERVSGDYKA